MIKIQDKIEGLIFKAKIREAIGVLEDTVDKTSSFHEQIFQVQQRFIRNEEGFKKYYKVSEIEYYQKIQIFSFHIIDLSTDLDCEDLKPQFSNQYLF